MLARHLRHHPAEDKNQSGAEQPEVSATGIEATPGGLFPLNHRGSLPQNHPQPRTGPGRIPDVSNRTSNGLEADASSIVPDQDSLATGMMFSESSQTAAPWETLASGGTGFDLPVNFGYNLEFPSVYEALNSWLTPMEASDVDMSLFVFPEKTLPGPALVDPKSKELSMRVQQAWPRRRASPVVRLIRTMWRCAVDHDADNLFSLTSIMMPSASGPRKSPRSRWNMDDECRERLVSDCETNLLPAENYTGGVTAPGSPRISVPSEQDIEIDGLSPQAPRLKFPSTEMLDMSIDFYFRRFHPVLPFIHQASFDAKATPSSILLPICLMGLSILSPVGVEDFIRPYLGKLIRFCRLNLTYKGLAKGGPQQLLTALASALLVLYLGLSCEELVDEYQAHMLAIQTLFIADRHGMFSAHDGPPVSLDMFQSASDPESQWKAWARVESVKRLVTCLIAIDSAYTRMLDLAANIGIDRVEILLPCDAALFEAKSATVFFQRVESGASMLGDQVDLGAASGGISQELASTLDFLGLRTMLDVLALREAAYRHKLLSKAPQSSRSTQFVPVLSYAQNVNAASMARDLMSIASARESRMYQDATTALSWNHLGLLLCADIDRVQTACGRMGLEASREALRDLIAWSQTASARRAILHAAQIFHILSQQRVSDTKTLLPDMILSNAALVMAVYVCVNMLDESTVVVDPVELTETANWSGIGDRGLCVSSTSSRAGRQSEKSRNQIEPGAETSQWSFIVNGGPFTFGGETYVAGALSGRKVVLVFAQLVDEISPRAGSEYSRLLRTISDFLGHAAGHS